MSNETNNQTIKSCCVGNNICCAPWENRPEAFHKCSKCGGDFHSFCMGARNGSSSKTCAKCMNGFIKDHITPIAPKWYVDATSNASTSLSNDSGMYNLRKICILTTCNPSP